MGYSDPGWVTPTLPMKKKNRRLQAERVRRELNPREQPDAEGAAADASDANEADGAALGEAACAASHAAWPDDD